VAGIARAELLLDGHSASVAERLGLPGVNIIDDGAADTPTGNLSLNRFNSGPGDTKTDRPGGQLN